MRRVGVQRECEHIIKSLRQNYERAVENMQPGEFACGAELMLYLFLDLEDDGVRTFKGSYAYMRQACELPWYSDGGLENDP